MFKLNIRHDQQVHPLTKLTTTRLQLLCWPISVLSLMLFLPASHNLPPLHPTLPPESLKQHYHRNHLGLQTGVIFILLSSLIYPIYGIGVSKILSRIPNVDSIMIATQAAVGVAVGLVFMISGILFATVTFRERDAALMQALSDLAWLFFTMMVPMLTLQGLMTAMIVWGDCRDRPVFPRGLAVAHLVLPVGWFGAWGTHFVHDGAFAWDGGITFWLTTVSYFVYMALDVFCFWVAAGECES